LDWTENPLIGLYFCVRDIKEDTDDGMLLAYKHGAEEIDIGSTTDPFSIAQIELVRPPHLDQRVIAQQSVFTAEPVGLQKGSGRKESAIRYWNVSARAKHDIKRELAKLGISESTLFPGLTTLAAEIRDSVLLAPFFSGGHPVSLNSSVKKAPSAAKGKARSRRPRKQKIQQ
jgi:hypothetical protein